MTIGFAKIRVADLFPPLQSLPDTHHRQGGGPHPTQLPPDPSVLFPAVGLIVLFPLRPTSPLGNACPKSVLFFSPLDLPTP